jgi:hypothetical protein
VACTVVVADVDAGGFAGMGAATVVDVDAGGVAGLGAAAVVDVDAGGCAGMGVAAVGDAEASPVLGAFTEVDAGVVVPAELVEPQPLSMENKGTNAAKAGTVNALAWNFMAAFSYRGMIQAKRKRLSMNSGVHADSSWLSAATSQNANHRPEAMHPDVRWAFPRCAALDHERNGSTHCLRLGTKVRSMLEYVTRIYRVEIFHAYAERIIRAKIADRSGGYRSRIEC